MYHRVTSLPRKYTPLGPYRRPMSRFLGGWVFLMSEVPLYTDKPNMLLIVSASARRCGTVCVESF